MAGMWLLSYTQRHDLNGKPYPGARASFFDASTGDPIDTYREPTLAVKHSNPVAADAFGVFPGVFLPDSVQYYGYRVTTAEGAILIDDAIVPNLAPAVSGGDPPVPIPATAVFKTGDLKCRLGEGIHEGWLPLNGRTIGSSTSGAAYVSDDYEALFTYLWNLFSGAGVVGGAGSNAAADWAANKQYTLLDMRGRTLIGLDDMDNDPANVLTGLTTLGQAVGSQTHTLTEAELPEVTVSGDTGKAGKHAHHILANNGFPPGGTSPSGSNYLSRYGNPGGNNDYAAVGLNSPLPSECLTSEQDDHDHDFSASFGSGDPHSIVQPGMGISIYIKL